jgi:CRP-like cAMP-binding protein
MQDFAALLAAVPPFSDFSPEELEEVVRHVQRRTYRTEETVFREGDPPTFIYYVQSGEIILTITSEDRRISVGKFPAGRLLGIQAVFDEGPQFLSAAAVTPATLLAIPRVVLLPLLRRHPETTFHLASVFARQIRAATLAVAEMQFLDLSVRLAKRILELAEEAAGKQQSRGTATVRATQKKLSELTGATRGGVNRALKRLEHLGIIRINRGTVTILDPDRLRELARHEPLPMILGVPPEIRG